MTHKRYISFDWIVFVLIGLIAGGYIQHRLDEANKDTVSEMLDEIPTDSITTYYKSFDYMLLDRIGQKRCEEYYNLSPINETIKDTIK
jgi:hypothetical protein